MASTTMLLLILVVAALALPIVQVAAFHDCVEPAKLRQRRKEFLEKQHNKLYRYRYTSSAGFTSTVINDAADADKSSLRSRRNTSTAATNNDVFIKSNAKDSNSPSVLVSSCSGGLCVGMKDGPHEGGPASYPTAWNPTLRRGTTVRSAMTVPLLPSATDGITYYIWTDVFFGDAGYGRMNQLVPQLLLGRALDGSTGPPDNRPRWGPRHDTWMFGAHYFFETYNETSKDVDSHAAYGDLYPAKPGEVLWTEFRLEGGGDGYDTDSPRWILEMGVQGDPKRTSRLVVDRPYMGLGMDPSWGNGTTASWAESSYQNMCINSCWELYGADDIRHLPSSGSTFDLMIEQPAPGTFDFLSAWEQDEGKVDGCPSSTVTERHNSSVQHIVWDISVSPKKHVDMENLIPQDGTKYAFLLDHLWETWKSEHETTMRSLLGTELQNPTEELYRRKVFQGNIQRYKNRGDHYTLDENAILTKEEFRALGKTGCATEEAVEEDVLTGVVEFACPVLNAEDIKRIFTSQLSPNFSQRVLQSKEIDYRDTQVTPVKNQGAYGTCWSFAFAETIEGLNVRQGFALLNISNQEVIDCCAKCRGRNQDISYHFVLHNRHINSKLATDDSYPYTGSPHNCSWAKIRHSELAPVKVGGCVRVNDDPVKSGEPILFALSLLGPAAFGIDASCLQGYSKGVITNCTDSNINHAVLLVGAGVDEESGVPYFRIKNSWGNKWGEDGYFRIAQQGSQLGFGSVVFATTSSPSNLLSSV